MEGVLNIAILFPKEYLCCSRVVRKVTELIANSRAAAFIVEDVSHPISKSLLENFSTPLISFKANIKADRAIIFCDEHFLKSESPFHLLPSDRAFFRFLYTPITRVINIKSIPQDIKRQNITYIGRGTPFGNPHDIATSGSRANAINNYSYDYHKGLLLSGNTKQLAAERLLGRFIACSCKPMDCHGDVIANDLNALDFEKVEADLEKDNRLFQLEVSRFMAQCGDNH